MEDYISYLDFGALKVAELAEKIGDYRCAIENYNKVLRRLNYYRGDSMVAIQLAGDFGKKSYELRLLASDSPSILEYETWDLSKTSFQKGKQCVKALYLDKFKRGEKTPPSEETQKLFEKGHFFEEFFRRQVFPDGINIKDEVAVFGYFNSYTKYLLNHYNSMTLFEAAIIEDRILVMNDVLVKRAENKYDFYEIKLHTSLNDTIKNDLAIQYYVCKKRFGDQINSFNAVLRKENTENEWNIVDVTYELELQNESIEPDVLMFKETLRNPEPQLSMGEHCDIPYECDFKKYCSDCL